MAYTPPPSPGKLRTPRDRALQIGTDASGFTAPMAPDIEAPIARDIGPQISYTGGAINPAKPFALK